MNTEVLHRCLCGKSDLPKGFQFSWKGYRRGRCQGGREVSWTYAQCHQAMSSQEIFQKRLTSLSGHSLLPVFPRGSAGDFLDDQIFRWPRRRQRRSGLSCPWGDPGPCKPLFRNERCCRFNGSSSKAGPSRAEFVPQLLQGQGVVTTQEYTGIVQHPLGPVPFHSDWFVIPFHCTKSWIKKACLYMNIFGIPFPAFAA